jgi:hypothetical protein
VDGVRNWQADEYGEVLVALLADFDENA